jgi:hypothetical protein
MPSLVISQVAGILIHIGEHAIRLLVCHVGTTLVGTDFSQPLSNQGIATTEIVKFWSCFMVHGTGPRVCHRFG